MRKLPSLLLTALALAACDFDLTGLGGNWFGEPCYGCYTPPPSVSLTGLVYVGPYRAEPEEAVVLLFAPSDTVTPMDSIRVDYGGMYWKDFGSNPTPAECGYVARAVKWTGEKTQLQPLFAHASSCGSSTYVASGPRFDLPEYPELDEPFAVWVEVRVAGEPARDGEVQLQPSLRVPDGAFDWSADWTPSDAEGRVVFETIDGAQRFALCRYVHATVQAAATGELHYTALHPVSDGSCGDARRLPDLRLGTRKAASGRVFLGGRDLHDTPTATAGEATVALVSAADSSVVREVFETYDDGSFHVWFPHEMFDPGCDWLLRLELGERVHYRPLLPPGATSCQPDFYHDFELTTG